MTKIFFVSLAFSQGSEHFNIITVSQFNYATRNWKGNNKLACAATGARTDQTIHLK